MRFKIDENLPVEVADLLRHAGHDALTVWDQHLQGGDDKDISAVCQAEKRAIVTLDVGFADIRTYCPDQFSGLIVLRLKQQDKLHVLAVVNRVLPLFSTETLDHHLWIVDEERIRIRS